MNPTNNLSGGKNFSESSDSLFLFSEYARCEGFEPRSEAQWLRLVKAPKSPTPENEVKRTCSERDALGLKTVIEYRDWADAWRIRTEVECISGMRPPEQEGLRESTMLSARGATKIAEACEFMHLQNDGFKTFVTGTFTKEVREKIASGETSIQKEVTRTMDALQKMYRRGWTKKAGERVSGHTDGLPYLWVVEIPENDDGEKNPHIHMLLGWSVKYADFKEWADRIERIWGNGYFHLEKIKDTACAGAYMAKAAGYLSKAADQSDQGTVQGNRYGISKTARAPAWVQINHSQLHAMGQLIYDVYDHLTVKYGNEYKERRALNDTLESVPKEEKKTRAKIGERLAKVRNKIKSIPIRCNKYQLVVTGFENAVSLFNWLKTPTENEKERPEWLPEKPAGWHWEQGKKPEPKNSQYFSRLYQKFARQKLWRRLVVPERLKELRDDHFWHQSKSDYENFYEPIPDYLDLCQ